MGRERIDLPAPAPTANNLGEEEDAAGVYLIWVGFEQKSTALPTCTSSSFISVWKLVPAAVY